MEGAACNEFFTVDFGSETMTRRKTLAIAGVAVALALAAGAGVAVALRPASLQQRLEQIRDGMTYAEVVEIMGEPRPGPPDAWETFFKTWEDRRGEAWIILNGDMKVIFKNYQANERTGFLDRVLAWLGL
jgi:outer membrane protein assembly factor BamE (lipoprotein component of BamABCDE complex)